MPHRPPLSRRSSCFAVVGLALLMVTVFPALAQTYWFENYERAVALIDSGQMAEASALLEKVIKDHPLPIACFKVPGDRCIDYVPYLHRARVQLYRGDTRAATHSLDITEAFGAGLQNRRTERQYLQMRQQIKEMEATGRFGAPATVTPAADTH